MLKQYANDLKAYNFYENFKIGYYLDALDQHRWKVGQIKQISRYGLRTTIEVKFDGYSSRFDTNYDLPSSHKLAPFRKYTLPFTGPMTIEVKRDEPKQPSSYYSKYLSKFNNLDKIKAEQINQFLRGEIFIYVDYLLTKKFSEGQKQCEQNLIFLLNYMKQGANLMKLGLDYLKEIEKDQFYETTLINVNPKLALLYASTQYLFNLNSLVSKCEKRVEFFRNYEKYVGQDASKKCKQAFINYGLPNLCQRIITFKGNNGRGLPWSLKKQAVIALNSFTSNGFAFPSINDNKELVEILDFMSYFSSKGVFTREEEDKKSLQIILSLIINGNFDGKLRGLNEIKKILDYPMRRKDGLLALIESKDLINILIDNKNFNHEIFKRSFPIFQFSFKNKLLTKKHLNSILMLHKDKHELELKSFYSCLTQFASLLDQETILWFFSNLAKLPLQQNLISLLKEFTITAINKNQYFRRNYSKQGEELALLTFWNLIQNTDLSDALKFKCIEGLAVLFTDIYYSKQVQKYILLAIKGILNRKHLQLYFKFIHEALKISKANRISKAIETAEKDVNIVDSVIQGLKTTNNLSDKMLESTFQFLEEVTYASKRKVTFNQIFQLWKLRLCRKHLLKLMRKYRIKDKNDKSQQKIINKQLPMETVRQIIEKIFLESKEMENYLTIDAELYQTADQLIIAYNNHIKTLDYNYKHTIRAKAPEKIIGTDFYLNIVNNNKSKQFIEKAAKRFIQIYLRVYSSDPDRESKNTETNKLFNWNLIVSRLSTLNKNLMLTYNIFFEQIKGRMKSINILEPQPVSLIVLNKATGQKKQMNVPRCTSIWKFRHLIAEQFKIDGLAFDMHLLSEGGFKQTNFEKEQDFSMLIITVHKQANPSIIIVPTKNKYPHLQTTETFLKQFAENHGQELYESLGNDKEVKQSISLLNKLPLLKKLSDKIYKLSYKDMNQIFDSNFIFKLWYQLKIITAEKNFKFMLVLAEKGFIPHLSKIFLKKPNHNYYQQSYGVLTDLMSYFIDLVKFSTKSKVPAVFQQKFLIQIFHYNQLITPEYVNYLGRCFCLIKDISTTKQLLQLNKIKLGCIFQHKYIEHILQTLLFNKCKERIYEIIFDVTTATNSHPILAQIVSKILVFEKLQKYQYSCKPLFDLICLQIQKKQGISIFQQNLKILLKKIKASNLSQKDDQANQLLIGYILILIKIQPLNLQSIIDNTPQQLANFIISSCLLNSSNPNLIRFKSNQSRSLAFKFLSLIDYSVAGYKIIEQIKGLMKKGQWRQQEEWSISPIPLVKKQFTGIKNLAATCYINSLLQQLLFIDNFSNQLLQIQADSIEDKENIALQIQKIFGYLKYAESSSIRTDSLCKTFIIDGQPIDPRVQTDVDEFFHSLMDKLERNLTKINKKHIINNIFGGQISNLIVGNDCEHTSQRIEPFLSIRLEIKDKKTLDQAFMQFIKGQILEGDNAYFCERCDKKVKATKRVCLKTLPEVLIITLKRFQFDFDTMQKFKLNSYCSFPQKLGVLSYTRDGIEKDHEVDAEDYQYRLKGVIIHYGISQAGHYTSYVRTDQKNWNYFDDEKISPFQLQNFEAQCFGGIQQNPFGDDQEKKKNAYLLFYEKIKRQNNSQIPIGTNHKKLKIYEQVQEVNLKNKYINILFDSNLQKYVSNLGRQKNDPMTFILYFHLVFLRSSSKKQHYEQLYGIMSQLLKEKQTATWYLSQINESFVYEFLIFSDNDTKQIITSLIIQSLSIANTDLTLIEHLMSFINRKGVYPMVKIFNAAAKLNKGYEKTMASFNFGQFVYSIIKNKQLKSSRIQQCKVKKADNIFGFANCTYYDKNNYDPIDLFQAVQSLKINISYQQLDPLIKRLKRNATQQSLATILVRKYQDIDSFNKFVDNFLFEALIKLQLSPNDEYIYNFFILIIQQFVKINDQFTPKRVERLAEIYLIALRQSLAGYKAELLLLIGLFNICSRYQIFRDKISQNFQDKEGKKLLKNIKQWIKEISTNISWSIKTEKLAYWRKGKSSSMSSYSLSAIVQEDDKINQDKFQASLNSIVEKHNLKSSISDDQFTQGEVVKYNRQKHKFLCHYGLLCEIQTAEKKIRIVPKEDIIKLQYF